MQIRQNSQFFKDSDHAVFILIKMHPSESEIYADLIISLSESKQEKYNDILQYI